VDRLRPCPLAGDLPVECGPLQTDDATEDDLVDEGKGTRLAGVGKALRGDHFWRRRMPSCAFTMLCGWAPLDVVKVDDENQGSPNRRLGRSGGQYVFGPLGDSLTEAGCSLALRSGFCQEVQWYDGPATLFN